MFDEKWLEKWLSKCNVCHWLVCLCVCRKLKRNTIAKCYFVGISSRHFYSHFFSSFFSSLDMDQLIHQLAKMSRNEMNRIRRNQWPRIEEEDNEVFMHVFECCFHLAKYFSLKHHKYFCCYILFVILVCRFESNEDVTKNERRNK